MSIPEGQIETVNLFVSTFPKGEGLLPTDRLVDLNSVLPSLDFEQRRELLSKEWNGYNDFNPNRILTATWDRDPETGLAGWSWGNDEFLATIDNTSLTLPDELTLTAGQNYYWAVEAFGVDNKQDIDFAQFETVQPEPTEDSPPFRNVTFLTHGFNFDGEIPDTFYNLAFNIADAGGEGAVLRYHHPTGYWVPLQGDGNPLESLDPDRNINNYPDRLAEYLKINFTDEPLVLLADWAGAEGGNESTIYDTGFSEAAADAFFTSLVELDQALEGGVEYNDQGYLVRNQGLLLDSPLHFVGFSRGTIVNSEIIQRLGTYFPEAGGVEKDEDGNVISGDLQMTTLDPHDFDQPNLGLNIWPLEIRIRDFYEPKIQVWENITFADNYYQTVPNLEDGTTFTPAGRPIPNIIGPDADRNAPGLQFPQRNGVLLGQPDVSVFLGGADEAVENIALESRAGFTRLDPFGATHGRVATWYTGTTNLSLTEVPGEGRIHRRRSDFHYDEFFDQEFYEEHGTLNQWYLPDHKEASFTMNEGPSEGIGTGWFHSVLGGGFDLRPKSDVDRVPLYFDNTLESYLRGDYAVPTLFNGNFNATVRPDGFIRTGNVPRFPGSRAIPGWSFHGGGGDVNTDDLVTWSEIGSLTDSTRTATGDPELDYALELRSGEMITHNRFLVPDWGVLRFDLHVPDISGGQVKVSMRGTNPGDQWQYLSTIKSQTETEVELRYEVDLVRGTYTDLLDYEPNQIGFGEFGFETFHMDVPDEFRGKSALLCFELEGSTEPVYLDNVFFKSKHVLLGNPDEARFSRTNPNETKYLMEKPQYSLSYNNEIKNANWVSWQLNQSWRGNADRIRNAFEADYTLPGNWDKVSGEPFLRPLQRGHLAASADRTRHIKDTLATDLMTNIIPQHRSNNIQGSAWLKLEEFGQALARQGKELYIIAGGSGGLGSAGEGINIPEETWKVIVILEPGQGIQDITVNTPVIAVSTPNFRIDRHPSDPSLPIGEWTSWITTVDEIENETGLDLLSNIPDEIQKILEERPYFGRDILS